MIKPTLVKVTVKRLIRETPDTITFETDKPKEFNYFAGQFATIDTKQFKELETVEEGRRHGPRAYSYTSSPTEDHLGFTIKKENKGKFSPWVLSGGINVGDEVEIRSPFGHFFYEEQMGDVVLIGAGSGIVPLRSIIRFILDSNFKVGIKLFVSNKTEKDVIYKKELDEWNTLNNVKVFHSLTREKEMKRIDEEHLKKNIGDFDKFCYFLCGPNDFCNEMKEIILKKGVAPNKVKMEKYG
ncbi:hypothetical protein HZA97_04810 [Candidatus Woesearchaeota archaeon]|nr:hypothetical protein [Candidatus Woesearchaeota archaeon]